jgi:DNA-binding response OmpR family regulator
MSAPREGLDATLLIVEDDPGALETFAHILRTRGYRILTTASAESALAEIKRASPSALLLDLHLPLSSGLEILRQLRLSPHGSDVRVAIMTGDYFLEETLAREIQTLGARIYFKPLWEDDLLQIARDLLGVPNPVHVGNDF